MNLWSGWWDEINYNWLYCGLVVRGRERKGAQKKENRKTKQNSKTKIHVNQIFYDEAVKPVCTNAKTFLKFLKHCKKNKPRCCFFGFEEGKRVGAASVSEKKLINGYKPFYRGKKFMPRRPSNDHKVSDSFFFFHMHAGFVVVSLFMVKNET